MQDIPTTAQHLIDENYGLHELISQLDSFSGPKIARDELIHSIQSRIRNYEESLDNLQFLVQDVTDEGLKRNYLVSLDRLTESIRLSKSKFRKAQINAKSNATTSWTQQREKLFAGASANSGRGSNRSGSGASMSVNDRLLETSQDITTTLRRMHQMAQTEVMKSNINIEELDASTKQLKELEQKYSAFDIMLGGSQRLIRHLEQADKWDRIYMQASLAFLGIAVLWILWHRIIGRLLGIFVLPLIRLFFWPIFKLFGGLSNKANTGLSSSSLSPIIEILTATAAAGASLPLSPEGTASPSLVESLASSVSSSVSSIMQHTDL